jgi:hypothetical protein
MINGPIGAKLGAEILVSIRPHNIKIKIANRTDNGEKNQLSGVVDKVAYLGDRVDYRILVGDSAIRVQTEPGEIFTEGTKVLLVLPPGKIGVIPARVH